MGCAYLKKKIADRTSIKGQSGVIAWSSMDGAVIVVDDFCACTICNRRKAVVYFGKTKPCGRVAAELQESVTVADMATRASTPRRVVGTRPGVASPILFPNHCGLGNPGLDILVKFQGG